MHCWLHRLSCTNTGYLVSYRNTYQSIISWFNNWIWDIDVSLSAKYLLGLRQVLRGQVLNGIDTGCIARCTYQ